MQKEEMPETGNNPAKVGDLLPSRVIEALAPLGIQASAAQAGQIAQYVSLLLRWNQRVSLTTITDPEQILVRHFGESLFGAQAAGIESGALLDVGSGAGFPSLPIAIFSPEIREILLEPNVKKAAFLAETCRVLGITGRVRILRSRLETYEPAESAFDFITSRAVRLTPVFLDRCRDLLAPGGKLVLWLGQQEAGTLAQAPGWIWADPVRIPGSERRFIAWGTAER